MNEDQNKPNPAWIEAPFEVDFLFTVPWKSTRKKQIKARRRALRKITQSFKTISETRVWHPNEYH